MAKTLTLQEHKYIVRSDLLSKPDRLPCTQYNEITKQGSINFFVLNQGFFPLALDSGDETI